MKPEIRPATKYTQSALLIEEALAIYGSNRKLAKGIGVPIGTIAPIAEGHIAMPLAMALILAEKLGRDPLLTIALIATDTTKGWALETWRALCARLL